ncbi:SDR family oxidoreductase [Asanoa iriomotensis]|uniref:NmrA family transcriptional regulator n=1 Tax=Asanoa iriomotensis TaxID=234613 RepID=A0ABQ4C8K6_9ACTN|nr:NAD(P)H-binding protein [Asanoa iriomotensis]GIF58660.1 NmrA family transcriptional regulator [Asanoa iriomotensis]
MNTPILVTGGTGTLGRHVVARLREKGADVRVLTRNPRPAADGVTYVVGDLATGAGADAAIEGVNTIVHCAGSQKGDEVKARHLMAAAARAGVGHVVYISVVGADRVPVTSAIDRAMFGYVAAKRAAEEIVAGSGVPYTTLRATQFHELAFTAVAAMAKLPVVFAPGGTKLQPIAADEVAARLVELALGEPQGLVADMGGPRAYLFADLARGYLRATGRRRPIVSFPAPGAAARSYRAGANLTPEHAVGHQTWEEFLTQRLAV